VNIACVVVCATVVEPGISSIVHLHPTSITPSTSAIAAYVGVIYIAQIGYCMMLVMARKRETKNAMVQGVGFSLVFSNFVMAFWAISWIMQRFLLATILQGILVLLLLFSNMALLIYHKPDSSRPLDTALIHAPLRFFLILPLSILFPLSLFVHLSLDFHPTPPGNPKDYGDWHAMAGFGVVLATNLLGLVVIVLRHDIVWCIAAVWIAVSVWSSTPKPAPVYITEILFTALDPFALIVAIVYVWMHDRNKDEPVALPQGDEHPGLYGNQSAARQPLSNDVERRANDVWVG
jgi:hypothetical protein